RVGQVEEGLTLLAEAAAAVGRKGGRIYEAELYRVKGELTLARSSVQRLASSVRDPQSEAEAEGHFWKAIEIAREQQAKSLELRAVTGLSRLWHQQGRAAEARRMLAETSGWFTEGFDTPDLREARALLEELGD